MIRYNWKSIFKHTNGDCDKIISTIYDIVFRSADIKKSNINLEFMLDPESLLINNSNATNTEICVYIYLCGLRSYFDYKTYNKRHLDKDVVVAALGKEAIDKLRHNRLVNITDKYVTLIYEENTNG